MKREIASLLGIATGVALAACANSTPHAKEAVMSTASAESASKRIAAKWPLKFRHHAFSVHCYDTYRCKVDYAGVEQRNDPDEELRPSSAGYGPHYQRNWGGGHLMIPNFPKPAKVSWRSKDGQAHETEIDFGKIFADEVIRHNVARADVAELPDGDYQGGPSVILEVNDRTIRVWMKAFIPTKKPQVEGKPNSDAVYEPVLVETYTY